jgi:succinate dehydrogenase/fumarate reductase flavoprotein subunit
MRRVPLQGHAEAEGVSEDRRDRRPGGAAHQIKDKSKVFNTARIEALELDNLIEVAKATIVSANARTESRGAHVRDDAIDTPEPRTAATTRTGSSTRCGTRRATASTTSR